MVNYNNLDIVYYSLSDPTRRDIIERLAKKPLTVSQVHKPYSVSLPAISKHLKVLEKAELIKRKKEGRVHTLYLNPYPLEHAMDHISFYRKFWNKQLDNLEKFLEESEQR